MNSGPSRVVLGIDAAWTAKQPSGVALVGEYGGAWCLLAVESSYQGFLARAEGRQPEPRPAGQVPDASALLQAGLSIAGRWVDLVAVDMPMSREPITGRRASDNAVSREYGGRKCSTHTPSIERPGPISDKLKSDFEKEGYALSTTEILTPGLIEVYPHPALVELARAPERLPYKAAKARRYWPELSPDERTEKLFVEWRQIIALLDSKIDGVARAFAGFGDRRAGVEKKATEDALDAVVCAWVGICALDSCARAFGDEDSAIWIPSPTQLL